MQNYDAGSAELVGAMIGAIIVPMLVVYVIVVAGLWKTFEKAGKPGWAAIIPVYNYIVLLEIVGKPIWWIFLLLFPCTSFIFAIWVINLLSKSFGQSEGFTIGLILLPFVFIPILGFGSSYKYLGPSAKEAREGFRTGPYTDDPFNRPPQI